MNQDSLPWVNYDEAMARVRELGDVALEQFVMRAVTVVVQRFGAGWLPAGKFDMLYFVGIMVDLYAQRDNLARIFKGEDLRWFVDE
jgi:hypothetical protein